MQIRKNVRERRRERIEQLIGQQAVDRASTTEEPSSLHVMADLPPLDTNQPRSLVDLPHYDSKSVYSQAEKPTDPDPELWWREREKRLKSGQVAGWQGLKGIPPTTTSRIETPPSSFNPNPFIRGLMMRFVFAALIFAAVWGWFKLELPGSAEARNWMVSSVSQDMDFQAVEAWYSDTFRGSPSFFPFNRNGPDTKEVSVLLSPTETVLPVKGTLVQSYAVNGTGVKMAATAGSEVNAIYTGRVQQVTQDPDGGVTIIVQHQNHIVTVYGSLDQSVVKPNDWVETGQKLGQLNSAGGGESERVLYFAVQQNGKTINPAEVVTFD